MNTTDRIKEQIETLVKNIDKIRAEENITLPTLILLETMSNYFDSFDFYREFADRYTKLSLPYSYSTELIKTTSPIVDDLEELTKLLRSTNSIRDKELADTFDLFLNSVQFAQVINDQNFVKENNTEQDYELDQYLGKIKSVDIVLDDQGNFGITFDLSINGGSMGTIDNTKRWKSQDTLKSFDPKYTKWSKLTTTYQCRKSMIELENLMKDAKVTKMSDLKGVAIEANFLEFTLKNFRILKEVL